MREHSDNGCVARAKSVKNAIAIAAMEGGRPSAFCLELLALYVSGEISGREMRERMLRKVRDTVIVSVAIGEAGSTNS